MEAQYVGQCDVSCVDIQTSLHRLDNMVHSLEQDISFYLCIRFSNKVQLKLVK